MSDIEQDYLFTTELIEDESSLVDELEDEPTPERRRIFTDKSDPPISSLYEQYKSGDLILDPHFQRRKVWDDSRSSRLIESAILEVPIPVFYFAEEPDGRLEVIDGQQRLAAFFRFLDNEYALKSLKAVPDLIGKHFKDLDKAHQRTVRNYPVRSVVFKKESDENLKFDIFERLNTGAVPLNQQELRNCIYRGPYNELLIELSEDPDYMFLMGLDGPDKRMRDVEYALRFAAFYHSTYLNYKPSMARFLNEEMKSFQNVDPEESSKLRKAFKNSVSLIRSLLGKHAFRRYYRGTEDKPDGWWEPKKFNASLYDIMMWSFSDKDKNQVMANLDAIREALIVLMTSDGEFIEAIELSTSATKMVMRRFDKWRMVLDEILSESSKQPRIYSRELKEKLYAENAACQICGQHIVDIDDAAVDHVEQYWLGGKTIPENARLTHRYCNWSRSRKDPAPA